MLYYQVLRAEAIIPLLGDPLDAAVLIAKSPFAEAQCVGGIKDQGTGEVVAPSSDPILAFTVPAHLHEQAGEGF